MTTKIKGFQVALDMNYREDDVEFIVNAIKMIKGVISVDPIEAEFSDYVEIVRVKQEMREKLYDLINNL